MKQKKFVSNYYCHNIGTSRAMLSSGTINVRQNTSRNDLIRSIPNLVVNLNNGTFIIPL